MDNIFVIILIVAMFIVFYAMAKSGRDGMRKEGRNERR